MSKFSLQVQEYDKTIAFIGIISSLILIVYADLFIGRIIYVLTGFLSLLSCIIWLKIRNNASLDTSPIRISNSKRMLLINLFFVFFTLSILSIHWRAHLYERPFLYFIFISLMICTVVFEIFSNKVNIYIIIPQIILIGIAIAWSQLLIFPTVLGVDSWFHQMFTQEIVAQSKIPDGFSYTKFPLIHLFIGTTSLITGTNYKFAAMLSAGLSQIICNIAFIYLVGMFLFKDKKVGLLASLLLIIANYHIFMNIMSIPNSFAVLFISPIIYINLKFHKRKTMVFRIISLFLMACIILTHTLTSMFAAIAFFILYLTFNISNLIYSKKEVPISKVYCFLFIVSMFTWWTFVSGSIRTLGKLIKWGFSQDYFTSTPKEVLSGALLKIPLSEQLFNNIGMFLFFAFSFIGCFFMISRKYGNSNTFSMSILGIMPLFIGFFSLITQHSVIEQRWWYFAQIFLSIPLAVSLLLVYNSIKRCFIRNDALSSFIMGTFVIVFSILLIMTPAANVDNNTFSPNTGQRAALTESEICAIYTISEKFGQTIGVDQYLMLATFLPIDASVIPINDEIYSGNFSRTNVRFILIRDYILNNPFKLYGNTYMLDYAPTQKLEKQGFSKVYTSKSVNLYSKLGV